MIKVLRLMLVAFVITHHSYSQPFKSYVPADRGIQVYFYKNVEFLGLVFFMGSMGAQYEHDETLTRTGIKKKEWFGYDLSLYKQYKAFQNNTHLVTAVRFAENMQGSHLLRLLIQLDPFPDAKLTATIPPVSYLVFSSKGDTAEAHKYASEFISALNQLYTAMDFDAYFKQYDNLYKHALQEIKTQLPSNRFIQAMETFYRHRFDQYVLLPSLTIPSGMAFAASYTTAQGKTHVFNAFGPFALQHFTPDTAINMGFADPTFLRELSTHEFGHSFTNAVLNEITSQQLTDIKPLFDTIKTVMNNQGYNTWKICLHEHFVRAGEVIIARNLGEQKGAEKLLAEFIQNRRFIYLPVIIEALQQYYNSPAVSYRDAIKQVMEKLKALQTNAIRQIN